MKTNKSFTKRIKVSRNGKLTVRKSGQDHFNAKEGGRSVGAKRRAKAFSVTNAIRSRFLSGKIVGK